MVFLYSSFWFTKGVAKGPDPSPIEVLFQVFKLNFSWDWPKSIDQTLLCPLIKLWYFIPVNRSYASSRNFCIICCRQFLLHCDTDRLPFKRNLLQGKKLIKGTKHQGWVFFIEASIHIFIIWNNDNPIHVDAKMPPKYSLRNAWGCGLLAFSECVTWYKTQEKIL